MTKELEELDALQRSEGWLLFTKHVKSEWGPEGTMFTRALALAGNDADDPTAMAKLRQALVAQREIQKLLDWVPGRVAHLAATELGAESDAQPMSRRGTL